MSEAEKIIPAEALKKKLQERVKEKLPVEQKTAATDAERLQRAKEGIENLVVGIVSEGLQTLERVQDDKLRGLIDGMYELHELMRNEHNELTHAHNETAKVLEAEIVQLKEQVERHLALEALEGPVEQRSVLETEVQMTEGLGDLQARVEALEVELKAERERRQEEERDRAFFAVGDEYLFGNRLRWAWRLTGYWWHQWRSGHAEAK